MRIVVAILLLALWPGIAQGSSARDPPGVAISPNCATKGFLVHRLEYRFGETFVVSSTLPSGNVLQLFLNKKTGTWTNIIVLNSLDPVVTCVIAAGRIALGTST